MQFFPENLAVWKICVKICYVMRESMQFVECPPFSLVLFKTFYLALYFWTEFFWTVKYVLYILKALLIFWLRLNSSTHLFAESECRINGTWRNTGTVFLKEFFKGPLCAIFFGSGLQSFRKEW